MVRLSFLVFHVKCYKTGRPRCLRVCNRRKCAQSEFEFLLEQTHLGGSTNSSGSSSPAGGRPQSNCSVLKCLNPCPFGSVWEDSQHGTISIILRQKEVLQREMDELLGSSAGPL
ncbi:hypothetical protein E1301_Tti005281 [Triplophysa tibetana]|uniref:Uncharacterized protein n=1 Tax=Triplophysa tibetana TaxID=1572043 RepID=A0A5A9PNL8_9TELE|nr:hypothetical protein E1301_Tti005281 [Triplophysa tibetana]